MQATSGTGDRNVLSLALNVGLIIVVAIQLFLFIHHVSDDRLLAEYGYIKDFLYPASLILIVVVLGIRHLHQYRINRQAESGKQQVDAMISMFSSVKHMLNNDMQVVLGNAELAEIVVKSGGDLHKPVHNISLAANDAIERIEQLSAFNATGQVAWQPVDLNATLRESMAKLAAEIPPIVNLKLELANLSTRVIADRYLLGLSLSHLIRQAINSMRHGGEIILRTSEDNVGSDADREGRSVRVEMFIVRALSHTGAQTPSQRMVRQTVAIDAGHLEEGLSTTKALVERSGAQHVCLAAMADESLISMIFSSERNRKWAGQG